MTSKYFKWLLFPAAVLMLNACRPVKYLGDDAVLLNKNIIRSDKKSLVDGATAIIKQKPNRKILGLFRFHLGVYTLANKGKETKFKKWVKNAIGEEPVVVNSELTKRSHDQLQLYIENSGYFNGIVTDTTVSAGKQKANVIYTIKTGLPYTIRNIKITSVDTAIQSLILSDTSSSLIHKGDNFNSTVFQKERERLTDRMRQHGYFDFNQQYIRFDIDSSLNSHQVDVYLKVDGAADSLSQSGTNHKIYYINNIYIQTDYNPLEKTLAIPKDTVVYKDYIFTSSFKKINYKPESLSRRIFIEKVKKYNSADANYTYKGLTSLGVFRFVNIRYETTLNDSLPGNWLNCFVSLTPSAKQEYKIELEGTNNGGNFGIGGNLIYINKNIFRGAELFEIKLKAKVESIPNFTDTVSEGSQALSFNTHEIGPELSLRIPGMLWPLHYMNKIRSANPVTLFKAVYNYQQRPEYLRNLATLSAGFEFVDGPKKKHLIYPAEINLSKFDLTDAFVYKLITSGDPELVRYYQSYLITNGRYTFIYNGQRPGIFKNFLFFRFNFEVAGNSLRLIDALTRPDYNVDSVNYEVFGTRYSQYIRPDADVRYYQVFNEHSSLIYRVTAGLGYAYLNSVFIPSEKAFYAGGANDLRAFRTGTVGPGSYDDTQNIQQFGDIKINMNTEYRFDIFKILEGAFFIDAGNIWLRQDITDRPGGHFQIDQFVSEFAVGGGAGLRFDFSFFIFRIDAAVPLRDPSRAFNDRWTVSDLKISDTVFNFGIGYPF
ncbi:MAG TPA: BamA/TamA family outer membrane protein [Bacteroidia bacterium]|nr:BamA/TamA family outer membrane protein [Bacteroidia bacterium]